MLTEAIMLVKVHKNAASRLLILRRVLELSAINL